MNRVIKALVPGVMVRTIVLLLLAAPCSTAAQSSSVVDAEASSDWSARPLVLGERVRVRWDAGTESQYGYSALRSAVTEVVEYHGTRIVLRRGHSTFSVPMSSVRSIDRRVGTKPASAPAMVLGSAAGFATGFIAGVLKAKMDTSVASDNRINSGITAGVLLGAPLGALIAWAASRERGIYERVGLGPAVRGIVVEPSGKVGVSLAVGTR